MLRRLAPALAAPDFERPPVRADLMTHAGLSLDDLTDLVNDGGPIHAINIFHLVALCWLGGLLWSSFVAQYVFL